MRRIDAAMCSDFLEKNCLQRFGSGLDFGEPFPEAQVAHSAPLESTRAQIECAAGHEPVRRPQCPAERHARVEREDGAYANRRAWASGVRAVQGHFLWHENSRYRAFGEVPPCHARNREYRRSPC
jgi:hypothetical protein